MRFHNLIDREDAAYLDFQSASGDLLRKLLQRSAHKIGRLASIRSEALYVANVDGTSERKLLPDSGFDYHASYSDDGKWIVFTSERSGYGEAD